MILHSPKVTSSFALKTLSSLLWISVVVFLLSASVTVWYSDTLTSIIAPQSCKCEQTSEHLSLLHSNGSMMNPTMTAIVYFQKPRRRFHGNHWYHIGEYFLSRHAEAGAMLNIKHNNVSKVIIVAHEPKLANMMTQFTFFLTVLAVTMHADSVTSVELYGPPSKASLKELKRLQSLKNIQSSDDRDNRLTISNNTQTKEPMHFFFRSNGPLFRYQRVNNKDEQTVEKELSDRRFQRIAPQPDKQFKMNGIQHRDRYADRDIGVPPRRMSSEEQRLQTVASANYYCGGSCRSGEFVGALGSHPINTSEWFSHHPRHVPDLRNHAARICNEFKSGSGGSGYDWDILRRSDTFVSYQKASKVDMDINDTHRTVTREHPVLNAPIQPSQRPVRRLNLVVYDRDHNRRFAQLPSVLRAVSAGTDASRWNIDVLRHSEATPPCALHDILRHTDVFLTTHGFQCTALIFMRSGAVLIEVFPYKYYKPTYVSLAAQFNIHYRAIGNAEASSIASGVRLSGVSTEQCMSVIKCRSYARNQDVRMPDDHIRLVVDTMVDVERGTLSIVP